MPTIEVSQHDLLEAVKQMPLAEFDALIEKAMQSRAPAGSTRLSAEETLLLERINRSLPIELSKRTATLIRKRQKNALTEAEHEELLKLTHEAETRDADRAAALLELANLRRMSLRALMKQMGIKAQPIHG